MASRRAPLSRLTTALVALALALLGFGHAPARAPDLPLAAWLAAGGAAEDLCHTDPGSPAEGHPAPCPVCTLAKAAALPIPAAAPCPGTRIVLGLAGPPARHLADRAAPPAPPARGPPSARA